MWVLMWLFSQSSQGPVADWVWLHPNCNNWTLFFISFYWLRFLCLRSLFFGKDTLSPNTEVQWGWVHRTLSCMMEHKVLQFSQPVYRTLAKVLLQHCSTGAGWVGVGGRHSSTSIVPLLHLLRQFLLVSHCVSKCSMLGGRSLQRSLRVWASFPGV